jgi:NAD(P)H dehydrogenase (quinone)
LTPEQLRLHKENVMIVVTGATGKLGRLVIEGLLLRVPAAEITAAVRDPGRAADFAERGVDVRQADYDGDTSWSLPELAAKISRVAAGTSGTRMRRRISTGSY